MSKFAWVLMVIVALTAVGCEKKSASDQLADDMKKAADKLKKDINSL